MHDNYTELVLVLLLIASVCDFIGAVLLLMRETGCMPC